MSPHLLRLVIVAMPFLLVISAFAADLSFDEARELLAPQLRFIVGWAESVATVPRT